MSIKGEGLELGLGPGYPGGKIGAEEPPGGRFGSRHSLEENSHGNWSAKGRSPAGG